MIVRHNGSREARCCASGRPLRERRTTSGKTLTLIGEKPSPFARRFSREPLCATTRCFSSLQKFLLKRRNDE
jgi:hypothetical protein